MTRLASILRQRLRSLFRRPQVEQELEEELRYHLEREIDQNLAAGMSAAEARSAAHRAISNIEQRKEECRDMRGINWLDNIVNDVRFAVRQLRKDLEFSLTAMLMLALGLTASVAIFAFVDAALLKPLPYKDPVRLVGVYEKLDPQCLFCNLSWPDYLDWKKLNSSLESLDIYQQRGFALTAHSGPQPVRAARVSDGFFRTLGVQPTLGRDFYSGEDQPGSTRTTILSYTGWQARFGGAKDVLGQTVVLDRVPYVIVGVLPRDFHFAPAGLAEFWVPFHAESGCDLRRSCHGLYGVGRLKPGVTPEAALANFVSIAQQLQKQYPDTNRDQGANVRPLTDAIVGSIRPILWALMAGAALLLLIAVIDVVGLLLVRSESRMREITVRTALGASGGRLLSQFITEAVVLVVAGVSLGIAGAHFTMKLLSGMLSPDVLARMPFLIGLTWNWRVASFALACTAICAILFSLAPSLRLWHPEIRAGLAEGSRGSSGAVWRRLGSKLVVLELATAVVLLVGAGLLAQSLHNLLRVNLGLEPDRLVTLDMAAPDAKYGNDPKSIALARDVMDRVRQLPGVTAVGLSANGEPLTSNGNTTWLRILGRPWHGEHLDLPQRSVSPAYFSTIGAKLVRGRCFDESEDASKPRVAIVNQSFVRKYLQDGNAIGQRVSHVSTRPDPIEIVGIVEDIRQGPPDEAIPPVVYFPLYQDSDTYLNLMVKTAREQTAILPALVAAIHQIDPEIITMRGATMEQRIEQNPAAYIHRSTTWLAGGFAATAFVLALVGLYGVIAYSVSRRTREIGVRMALGASSGSVYGMVLKEAARLVAAGVVVGLGGAAIAGGLLRALLFGVSPWDPLTMAGIAVTLAVASLAASFVPARRAASVNPVEALRSE